MRRMLVKLSRINTLLTIAIFIICSYVILLTLMPAVIFQVDEWRGAHDTSPYPIKTFTSKHTPTTQDKPREDRLVIPGAGINEPIITGDETALNEGIWLVPKTSTPDQGGNTVLAGHRFLYTNALFYNLDKTAVGDIVALFWKDREYNYEVTSVTVVSPSAIEILNPSDEPQLTMYTCTPLWTSKNRLVVKAKLTYKES